jgi:hypothetical protein
MFEHAQYFAGMITMGMIVCAAFFFRFWLRSKDSLFLAFSLAFVLLALSHALTAFLRIPLEERSWLYLLRLAAYALLIFAILRKNVARGAQRSFDDSRASVGIPFGLIAAGQSLDDIDRTLPLL